VTNLAFDTTSATFDGPGHCMNSPNIWYRYTATCTGDVTVSLLGSSYDTKLAVYRTSTCYPAAAALIECNDDFGSSYQSQITFAGTSGQQYLIEVGGYGSAKGQGKLTTSCTGTTPTQQKPDLGDAPDSTNNLGKVMHAYPSPVLVPGNFPTVYDDLSGMGPRGPAHVNTQVVAYLGKKITSETEADKGTDEDGVNNIRPLSDTANRDDGDDSVRSTCRIAAGPTSTIPSLLSRQGPICGSTSGSISTAMATGTTMSIVPPALCLSGRSRISTSSACRQGSISSPLARSCPGIPRAGRRISG